MSLRYPNFEFIVSGPTVVHRWGRAFGEDGYGLYAEKAGSHQGFEVGTLLVVFLDGTEIECKNEDE